MPRGRPSKRTPLREQIVLECLRSGMTITASAAKAGIDGTTLSRWREVYPDFAEKCARAEADAEAHFTAALAKASTPHEITETITIVTTSGETSTKTITRKDFDWRAAESWLKRRRPADWGDNIQHVGSLQHVHMPATEEQILAAADEIRFRRLIGADSEGQPDGVQSGDVESI